MDAGSAFLPVAIRLWMHFLNRNAEVSKNKLIKNLEDKFNKDIAQEIVEYAINSDILTQGSKTNCLRFNKTYNELAAATHDFYCYECHKPGNLEKCGKCYRSFHRDCYRKKIERPNCKSKKEKLEKNKLPLFSDEDSESDNREHNSISSSNTSNCSDSTLQVIESTGDELVEIGDDRKPEVSDCKDVIFVAELPPPVTRRNRAWSYKSEQLLHDPDDNINEINLCTACRLVKKCHNPPNLSIAELAYLLNFCFNSYESWLEIDIQRYMNDSNWTDEDKDFIKTTLFKCNAIDLNDIAKKIREERYIFLRDFLIDLLDLQHNVSMFFGHNSEEGNSTKYLLRDVMHDVSEIRRCPDCYRYSNEKTKFWFAKPCVQRHELVYAQFKKQGYWPAKVIRVLNKHNKYDVRFFGGDHTRALLPASRIKPIDTDVETLHFKKSNNLTKSFEELYCYQSLMKYPASYFGFYADRTVAESVICNALCNYVPEDLQNLTPTDQQQSQQYNEFNEVPQQPTNVSTTTDGVYWQCDGVSENMQPSSANFHQSIVGSTVSTTRATKKPKRKAAKTPTRDKSVKQFRHEVESNQLVSKPCKVHLTNIPLIERRSTRSSEGTQKLLWADFKDLVKKFDQSKRNEATLRRTIEKQECLLERYREQNARNELEIRRIKCSQWCHTCLSEATFICCFKASYCSLSCKLNDWEKGHREICQKTLNNNDEPSSTT